ncbi:MAG: putative rane protein, partial [Nocardioidaceae bacterium]|nr:putative rane protein [Nocardioidaceae bacterium]
MAPASEVSAEAVGLRTHPLTSVVQGALWAAAASVGLIGSVFTGDGWGDMSPLLSLAISLGGGLVFGMGFGFVSWRFTRYVIDGTELRINSGIITKASRRIPYERIQSVDIAEPLVARVFGLAELRIEMAGGKDSRTSLRFLKLDDARDLRR